MPFDHSASEVIECGDILGVGRVESGAYASAGPALAEAATSPAPKLRSPRCTVQKMPPLFRDVAKIGMCGKCLTYSRCLINGFHYDKDGDD